MERLKRKAAFAAVLIAAVLAAGCSRGGSGQGFDPDQNSIYIKTDGTVENATVVYTQESYYEEEGLREEIQSRLLEFNAQEGSEGQTENQEGQDPLPAALVSCSVSQSQGQYQLKYILAYRSPDMLLAFNQMIRNPDIQITDLDVDTVEDCLAQGGLVGTSFLDGEGQPEELSRITSQGNLHAVTVQGSARIQTQGKIQYVSQGCQIQDEYTVQTPQEGVSYIIFK